MTIDDRRLPWPDLFDARQARRTGASWPTHKARARNRRAARYQRARAAATHTEGTTR